MSNQISLDEAKQQSSESLIWRATLRSGEVILEAPGMSSDALPRDDVVSIEYLPSKIQGPVIETRVDLDRGERFVRYWTTIRKATAGISQRLYVAGVEHDDRFALFAFYPQYGKIVFATTRPFQPPWEPNPFALLPPDAEIIGGPGTSSLRWIHEGFGGELVVLAKDRLVFKALSNVYH